jgi:hypothetical protein
MNYAFAVNEIYFWPPILYFVPRPGPKGAYGAYQRRLRVLQAQERKAAAQATTQRHTSVSICIPYLYTWGSECYWGGISPRINFGGQISSLGFPTNFFWIVSRKPTNFFRRKICPAKNLRRLQRHFFYFLCIFLWAPEKNPPNISYKIPPPPIVNAPN